MLKCLLVFDPSRLWAFFLILQIVSYGAYPILVDKSKVDGILLYSTASTNFIIELFKLLVSLLGIFLIRFNSKRQAHQNQHKPFENSNDNVLNFSIKDAMFYLIPGILYFINNNLVMYMFYYMDATTFQILSNLKIFTTAILYYLIIGKKLSAVKWFSLGLLVVAGVFYIFGNLKSKLVMQQTGADANVANDVLNEMFITTTGVLMIVLYSFISGFAAVYSEYLLKINFSTSIHLQNTYLYVFGVVLNLIAFILHSEENVLFDFGYILHDYNYFTWVGIATQVFTGLAISIVMKHSSNITRLFIISSSLIVNAALSFVFLSLKLNVYFLIAFFVILISIWLYTKK